MLRINLLCVTGIYILYFAICCFSFLLQSPGFLWSFNYMLTRRWKSPASGEEAFGELLLHDFRNFCANKNDRLRKFCESFLPDDDEATAVTISSECMTDAAKSDVVPHVSTGASAAPSSSCH